MYLVILMSLFVNVMLVLSSPTGRKWEYGSKIEHPHGHSHDHYGHGYHDKGKGWTHTSDTGPEKHYHHYEEPIHIPIHKPIHIPVHKPVHIPVHIPVPVHIPKYDHGHEYGGKLHEIDHWPKKYEEPKKHGFGDDLDIKVDVDGIIDDIQKDLKKTGGYEASSA